MSDLAAFFCQSLDEIEPEADDPLLIEPWTQGDVRDWIDALSDHVGNLEGIPVPLGDDMPLTLRPGHPLEDFFTPREFHCSADDVREDERVVNHWVNRSRNLEVFILDHDGKREVLSAPLSPDRSMNRLRFWLNTIGGSDGWDIDAEYAARDHLRGMLTERQWRHYDLTGAFFETSARSRLTYVFRRLRPVIALSPRGRDGSEETMRCLAVLCLHPIGYYQNSWAGCMVPSDDVIASLSWMRADEAGFWGKAIAHQPSEPEAGL